MTAKQAIERSVSHTEIVTLDWSEGVESTLYEECDGCTGTRWGVELWGTTAEGGLWRVHLKRGAL